MTDPTSCQRCGLPHVRCAGHRKSDGQPCMQPPMRGSTVCRKHGAKAPQVLAAAERRTQIAKAEAAVARLNLRREIDPNEALLEEVYRCAGVVAFLDVKVTELKDDDMVWGVTEEVEKRSGEYPGTDTTRAAELNAWIRFWQAERDRLVRVSKEAIAAGIEERQVRLAERQGALIEGVIRLILADLQLTPPQLALVPTVVPRRLREVIRGEIM